MNLSISLSLSSRRIQLFPQSQELLSLLSMLPDGLADVDLIQSNLPLENILKCKTTLKSTALAYSDEHKRLKVLMPIQEYLQRNQPPRDHLIQKVFEYFEEMLKFYTKYSGTQSNSKIVPQIKSKLTNIQNVLQWGLKQNQPNLSKSIYCQWSSCPNSDFEALALQALDHLKHFDDPDLESRLYICMASYYQHFKIDLFEATNMCKKSISLAILTGNSRRHSQALHRLAWNNIQLGKYSAAQIWQELPGIYIQKHWLSVQRLCAGMSLVTTKNVSLWASGHRASLVFVAEVHKSKSEYSEAWKIHSEILRISANQDPYNHATALLNLAELEVPIGVPRHDVQQNIDLARSVSQGKGSTSSKVYFEKSLKLAPEDDQIKTFCLEKLGNINSWGPDESIPGWTTIFLSDEYDPRANPETEAPQSVGQTLDTIPGPVLDTHRASFGEAPGPTSHRPCQSSANGVQALLEELSKCSCLKAKLLSALLFDNDTRPPN
ncbi:hypothetical protein DFH08DRAFT_818679 [Mycena albidolilacea]|uniref:Uncharacterized protein n=1 Tax=Mycena albidolilacea TaxID=1033008 RepID=A0AAD7EHD6_9AGAR|nr:hypothetical protein DFH08DRAFT_818679 [Mycena albidolilacea]